MSRTARAALFAAAAATALSAGAVASAQSFDFSGVYIKGFGGATWPSGDDESLRRNGSTIGRVDLDYDTGYTLGVALGFTPTPNIGVEVEYAYRNTDYDGQVRLNTGGRGNIDGTAKVNAVMVNALYNFTLANPQLVPYVGGGLGAAQLDYEGDTSEWNFAYQAIAGIGYEVAPQVSLYGEGRWFGVQDSKVWPGSGTATDLSYGTFDLLFGVKYQF